VRWIDLGCPIDLHPEFDPANIVAETSGYLADDHRPTLVLTYPAAGRNAEVSRLLIGLHDYESGLDMSSFRVTADVAIDDIAASENLAAKFQPLADSRWELKLKTPIKQLSKATLTVSISDREGNIASTTRSFSVGND
jgi:hypothetical protein